MMPTPPKTHKDTMFPDALSGMTATKTPKKSSKSGKAKPKKPAKAAMALAAFGKAVKK